MHQLASRRRSVLADDAELLTVGAAASYNIGLITLFLSVGNMWIQDVKRTGKVILHTDFLIESFGGFHIALGVWLAMMFSLLLMQMCFRGWAMLRLTSAKESLPRQVLDRCALAALVLYLFLLLALPALAVRANAFPPGTAVVLLAEQMRSVMKAYAYTRSQTIAVLRVAAPEPTPESQLEPEPNLTLSHFAYFLFAPTLVYEDRYPRSKQRRLLVVARHAVEVVVCLVIAGEVYERFLSELSRELLQRLQARSGFLACAQEWLLLIVQVVPPCALVFITIFYLMLHAVQNAFGEMLRHLDRSFYLDWWNVSSMRTYFRSWNRIVQMWLYVYIYKELKKKGASRAWAKWTVFTISALFHEFVLIVALGFLFPMQFFLFGVVGFIFSYEPEMKVKAPTYFDFGNLFFLTRMLSGSAILFISYTVEYYARINCARQIASSWDLIVPRSLFCEFSR